MSRWSGLFGDRSKELPVDSKVQLMVKSPKQRQGEAAIRRLVSRMSEVELERWLSEAQQGFMFCDMPHDRETIVLRLDQAFHFGRRSRRRLSKWAQSERTVRPSRFSRFILRASTDWESDVYHTLDERFIDVQQDVGIAYAQAWFAVQVMSLFWLRYGPKIKRFWSWVVGTGFITWLLRWHK